jgi:thiosulfate/3-mercaptopyruvate sulfurtransferase
MKKNDCPLIHHILPLGWFVGQYNLVHRGVLSVWSLWSVLWMMQIGFATEIAPVLRHSEWQYLQKDSTVAVILLDVREKSEYQKGHMDNSIWVQWTDFVVTKGSPGDSQYGTVLPIKSLQNKIHALGIQPKSVVVVVGSGLAGWGEEGFMVWVLRYAGIQKSVFIDGGMEQQLQYSPKSAPTQKKPASLHWLHTTNTMQVQAQQQKLIAHTAQIESLLVSNSFGQSASFPVVLLDTRSWLEYRGASLYGESRGGRIPGALHLHWKSFFTKDGTVLSKASIQQMMKAQGIEQNTPIISYCSGGVRSALVTIALQWAGYTQASNYQESMWQWTAAPHRPLARF